jgi:hypothetical protein
LSYGFQHRQLPTWKAAGKSKTLREIVWADTVRKILLEFPLEDAGLEALHLHGEPEQLKIGLPFAF